MPLAIWTPIKGYGQVSKPFQEVCTQMWQNAVASVSALTSCSKCWGCQRQCLHPHCPLCSLFPIHEQSHKYKSKRMQSAFCNLVFASFLFAECYAVGQHVGDFYCWGNKAELWLRTTSDGDLQLHPSFHHFTPLILPLFSSPHSLFLSFTVSFRVWRFDASSTIC